MAHLYLLKFPNGKLYVGIANDPSARFRAHRTAAKNSTGQSVHRAIAKFGWDSVEKSLLTEDEFEAIKAAEQFAIAFLCSRAPNGYNLTDGGDGAVGAVKSEKEKQGIRDRMKGNRHTLGKTYSKEEKATHKKWKHTQETKEKIKVALVGRKRTPIQIEACKAGANRRWSDPEQRAQASEIAKERCARPGMKERMQESGRKIVHTKEQREKHSIEMRLFHEQRRNGVHNLSMAAWFSSRKAQV